MKILVFGLCIFCISIFAILTWSILRSVDQWDQSYQNKEVVNSSPFLLFSLTSFGWISALQASLFDANTVTSSASLKISENVKDPYVDPAPGSDGDDPALCQVPIPGRATDRRQSKEKLVVVEFNAEWLFLNHPKCPSKDCPWKDRAAADKHLQKVAEVIDILNGDIIHFNEVQDCNVLNQVLKRLKQSAAYRAYMVPGKDTALGQNVGIITKVDPLSYLVRSEEKVFHPIPGSQCGHDKRGQVGVSKHYLAEFRIRLHGAPVGNATLRADEMNLEFLLSGAHLYAFPDHKERCSMREAQALVIHNAMKARLLRNPRLEAMILGDLNDFDPRVPAADKSLPISNVLQILSEVTQPVLSNVAADVAQRKRYTSWYDRNKNCMDDGDIEHSLIDHILVSKGLSSRLIKSYFYHAYDVSCADRVSDHWPLIAEFDMTYRK